MLYLGFFFSLAKCDQRHSPDVNHFRFYITENPAKEEWKTTPPVGNSH